MFLHLGCVLIYSTVKHWCYTSTIAHAWWMCTSPSKFEVVVDHRFIWDIFNLCFNFYEFVGYSVCAPFLIPDSSTVKGMYSYKLYRITHQVCLASQCIWCLWSVSVYLTQTTDIFFASVSVQSPKSLFTHRGNWVYQYQVKRLISPSVYRTTPT